MRPESMINGFQYFLKEEGMVLHKVTETHVYLIVPKDYGNVEGWEDRLLNIVDVIFSKKLKIARAKK